ncbi:hypothetical protein PC123_g21573 [Phytophthora cactorum]|nr:hypothetical protein PC120_g22113 [Phytophthora cactorum]KAG4042954.1 hypothetical protein PC123_g21573 [Phytophthora cactorum]
MRLPRYDSDSRHGTLLDSSVPQCISTFVSSCTSEKMASTSSPRPCTKSLLQLGHTAPVVLYARYSAAARE